MKELIDEQVFITGLRGAAVLLMAAGLVFAILGWRLKKSPLQSLGLGLVIAGPLLWLLWLAYGKVIEHFGLDSVKGLGVNIVVFVIAGILAGLMAGLLNRRRRPKTE